MTVGPAISPVAINFCSWMLPLNLTPLFPNRSPQETCRPKPGFALVVTLSLMILLTLIAVGLLSLSAVSLRSSSQAMAMTEAQANARLALMLAIGDLQKSAGPDRRVTAPANLVKPTHPEGVTGVWKSWKPAPSGVSNQNYVDAKTGANFLGYLMSNPNPADTLDPQTLPSASVLGSTDLVSTGSVGSNLTNRKISAPLISVKGGAGGTGNSPGSFAWVVLDEGVKSRIDLLCPLSLSLVLRRARRVLCELSASMRFTVFTSLRFVS